MQNSVDGVRVFAAALSLHRKQITSGSLALVLLRFPFQSMKIILAIYWEALRLWIKRCPLYAHPGKTKEVATP